MVFSHGHRPSLTKSWDLDVVGVRSTVVGSAVRACAVRVVMGDVLGGGYKVVHADILLQTTTTRDFDAQSRMPTTCWWCNSGRTQTRGNLFGGCGKRLGRGGGGGARLKVVSLFKDERLTAVFSRDGKGRRY
jgi:hypothetical protein